MVLRIVYYSIKREKLQPLREKNYGKLVWVVGSDIVNFFKKTYCKKTFYLL